MPTSSTRYFLLLKVKIASASDAPVRLKELR